MEREDGACEKDAFRLWLEYGSRVDNEISIFSEARLSSYFLIVQDILKFCNKSKDILRGRDEVAPQGAWFPISLGSTQIDPVQV